MNKCPNCGTENIIGANYCKVCGTNIQNYNSQSNLVNKVQETNDFHNQIMSNNENIINPQQYNNQSNFNNNNNDLIDKQETQQPQVIYNEYQNQSTNYNYVNQQPVQEPVIQPEQQVNDFVDIQNTNLSEYQNQSQNYNYVDQQPTGYINENNISQYTDSQNDVGLSNTTPNQKLNEKKPNKLKNIINNSFNKIKNTKRKTLPIIGILVFLVLVLFLSSNLTKGKTYSHLILDPNRPIMIEKDDKYGFISSKGKLLIEPKFSNADNFIGDYALVSLDDGRKMKQVINKKGQIKIETDYYTDVEYYPECDFWIIDNELYNSSFKKMFKGEVLVYEISPEYFKYVDENRSGIINCKGKKIFKWNQKDIYVIISENENDTDELFAKVYTHEENEKEIIISLKTGKTVFDLDNKNSTDYRIYVGYDGIFSYNYKSGKNEYEKFLFFMNNKLAYETTEEIYDLIVYDWENKILRIDYGYDYKDLNQAERYKYYDAKKNKYLNERPEIEEKPLSYLEKNGYRIFEVSRKYGIIKNNKVIIQPEYNDIDSLSYVLFEYIKEKKGSELIFLKKDNKTILYNLKNKKPILTIDSKYVNSYYNSTFIKAIIEDDNFDIDKIIIYNLLTGAKKEFSGDATFYIGSNYLEVLEDDKIMYYNTKLSKIYEIEK